MRRSPQGQSACAGNRNLGIAWPAACSCTNQRGQRNCILHAIEILRPMGMPLHAAIEEFIAARSKLNGVLLLSVVNEYLARKGTFPSGALLK